MFFFGRTKSVPTPPAVDKYRKETHRAAKEATKEIGKLNEIMGNGITLKVYLAVGGKHR